MSNYRDDVRDMLKTLKGAKPSTASPDSSKPAESESPEPAGKLEKGAKGAKKEGAASDLPLTDEEDLLDDILDLEGGNNGDEIEDLDAEAEALLADSDNEDEEKNKSADKVKPGIKKKDSSNGKDKSESPKTDELEDSNEKTENGKEDEQKDEIEKMEESTGEEKETAELEKTEEDKENSVLVSDEEIKEDTIEDKSPKKSKEERAKDKANLPKKGKKNAEVIDEKELEDSEPEIETIESDDDDAIAEVLETKSNSKKKVDTTEVTLVDDTNDSNSIEEINDTPADSIAQISDDETEEKDEDSKQQSEVEEITEETEPEIPAEPCTPHCPGASGFPDLECTRCQSLFHSKCVGVEESDRSTFKCRICTPVPAVRSLESKQPVRKAGRPKGKNLMANAMAKAQKMAEDAVECVDLSSDDENADTGNGTSRSRKTKAKGYVTEEETTSEEDVDESGDPDKPPGEDAEKEVQPDFLVPFNFGWRREVVFRQARRAGVTNCDVYYIPPQDGRYRTREAKRKRRSKKDQERYFEDFPDDDLSIKNFNYVKKQMGLNNAAYEVVRQAKLQDAFDKDEAVREEKAAAKKSMKEVEESAGLLELPSEDDLDDEVKLINGFDLGTPLTLQATQHVSGMQNEYKKRKKIRDPETCCTPPLVEDQLWTNLSDDPVGVYTDLGGRSSPVTPPPLRAVKLTYVGTREKILKALQDVKDEAFKFDSTKELDLIEEQATHDYLIKKYKNYKAASKWDEDWCPDGPDDKNYKPGRPPKEPGARGPRGPYKKTQNRGGLSSSIMSGAMNRACTPKCPGSYGILPSLQCVGCKAMFHAKCQGTPISPNMRVFRCRRCSSRSSNQNSSKSGSNNFAVGDGASVKLKLPMLPKGGKRPIVELVLRTPEGRYQPIKFRNNSQITENIPRTLFHKANQAKKTLYVKSQQLPRLNGKPVFLAINPLGGPPGPGRPPRASHDPDWGASPSQQRAAGPPTGDQVAILVRPQKAASNSKPVLLNVPRKVALKVKVGTTLSFSASNDHKYIVMDSKIHPPVGTGQRAPNRGAGRPSGGMNKHRLPSSLSVIPNSAGSRRPQSTLSNLMNNKRPGLTITRGPQGSPGSYIPAKKVARKSLPSGSNILASGEVVSAPTASYTEPCTPYCPGVSGFPDLECTRCQSLFHSKCVGINELLVDRIRSTFKCRICTPVPVLSRPKPKPARPKSLGGGSVTVINLD